MRLPMLVLVALVSCAAGASAQSAKDFVGTWQHVKNVNTAADGGKTDAFGANPKGVAIFTEDGHFSVILMRSDVPKIAVNNRVRGTDEENRAIVHGTMALYGTYSVDGKTLKMKVDGSLYPNWNGTEQPREIVSFSHDEFTFRIPASATGGSNETTFRRMK